MTPIPPSYLFRDLDLAWKDANVVVEAAEPPPRGGLRWSGALADLGRSLSGMFSVQGRPARLAAGRA